MRADTGAQAIHNVCPHVFYLRVGEFHSVQIAGRTGRARSPQRAADCNHRFKLHLRATTQLGGWFKVSGS